METNSVSIRRMFLTLCLTPFLATQLIAEEVTKSEFQADVHGYPCFVTMHTGFGTKFTTQLSDYQDVWSLNFFFSGQPMVFLRFFKSNGLQDQDALAGNVREISIGGKTFDLSDVHLFAVQRSEVDETTPLIVTIETEHRVALALEAMQVDQVQLAGIISLTKTSEGFREFRSCAMNAMGLQEGQKVEVDYREEYRLSFEKAFALWVSAANRADSCSAGRLDDEKIDDVIERASSAFYPGMTNLFQRGRYEEELRRQQTFAAVDGRTSAVSDGCFMADSLAEITEKTALQAIESAETQD